ncbi:MAG: HEAT repeat domain-containing protein [SAR324 cluster bacterium]|nr:HEAT repeat domain-containing protein [SAR324 cluster bacterium]
MFQKTVLEDSLAPFTQALDHQHPEVRKLAIQALGVMGSLAGVLPLLTAWEHQSPEHRESIMEALSKIYVALRENPETLRKLQQSLSAHQSTVDHFVNYLAHENLEIRYFAVWAVGACQKLDHFDAVFRVLLKEESPVQEFIISTLRLSGKDAFTKILDKLDHEDASLKAMAAWALGIWGEPGAVPALIRHSQDPSASVRENIAWALGMLESIDATATLMDLLRDPYAGVREHAVWALGMLQNPESLTELRYLLDDPDPQVREKAFWAVGNIEDSDI